MRCRHSGYDLAADSALTVTVIYHASERCETKIMGRFYKYQEAIIVKLLRSLKPLFIFYHSYALFASGCA